MRAILVFFGTILATWLAYNVLVARQAEFRLTAGGLLFMTGLFFVGGKWIVNGWPDVQQLFRPKRHKKRKRRDVEYDSE
jgi:hypothetical protein